MLLFPGWQFRYRLQWLQYGTFPPLKTIFLQPFFAPLVVYVGKCFRCAISCLVHLNRQFCIQIGNLDQSPTFFFDQVEVQVIVVSNSLQKLLWLPRQLFLSKVLRIQFQWKVELTVSNYLLQPEKLALNLRCFPAQKNAPDFLTFGRLHELRKLSKNLRFLRGAWPI